ncbi:MucBP domain-containing protein [Leuconostoc pseudomesenteroides]|uniref:MucBP domain-containing protein n=1 Tax=Leuconostoc pseudomesenteroides TaxID=33968 RepID=UPI004035BBDE
MNNKKNLALKSSVITTTITLAMISSISVSANENQISNSEKNSIQNFIDEKPSNGSEKKIATNTAPESDLKKKNSQYKFPGLTNYQSIIQSKYLKITTPDDRFFNRTFMLNGENKYKIKNVDGLFQQSQNSNNYSQDDRIYYVKKITVIDITNNQESTYENAIIFFVGNNYYQSIRLGGSQWINDIAIENEDPRFNVKLAGDWNSFAEDQVYENNEYWTLTVPDTIYEDYDTIVKIDESLKSGEEIVNDTGSYGEQHNEYEILPPVNSSINSDWYKKDFNSDLIINNLLNLQKDNAFENSKVQQSENKNFSIVDNGGTYTAPQNRVIRVGVDYTKYVDTLGNEISPEDFGIHDKKNISGYYFLETKKETNGDTIHVYSKQGSLVVNYVDKDGNKLATSDNETGNVDSSYTTKPKEISGYKLVETPSNANGTYTGGTTTVNYVYEKEQVTPPATKQGDLVVNYVDKDGNKLATSDNETGDVDSSYTTKPKEISGYKLVETPSNANGTYTDGTTTVNYVYEKEQVTPPATKQGDLVVNYIDKDGNKLATSDNETCDVDSTYTTKPKEISGYKLVETPSNANGTYTDGTTTVNYVYEKEQQPVVTQADITNPEKNVSGNKISQHGAFNSNKKDNSILLPKTSVNQKNQDNTPLMSILTILSGIVGINFFKNKQKNK